LSPLSGNLRDRCQSSQHQPRQAGHGLYTEKKTLTASEQNEEARTAWREKASEFDADDLIFLDETGSHIAMTPLYAYAHAPVSGRLAPFRAIRGPT
jgi:hypothetical protein